MKNFFAIFLLLVFFSLPFGFNGAKKIILWMILAIGMIAGQQGRAQPNNYKPGPNKMVINLEASTQKFEVPVKDVKTKVNNELTYSWYKSNQILQTKGGYDGKLLHGAFAEFYLNNNLKEKGIYKKGLKNREWKSWHENGQLKEIVKYCNGINHGKYQSYNEKGELTLEANYKNGKLHGETLSYENGKILTKHKYKNGNEVFPKPKKIKEEKKKKFNWKFWKKKEVASKEENPKEKQPDEKPIEKEKKDPGKKANPKEPKTSKG